MRAQHFTGTRQPPMKQIFGAAVIGCFGITAQLRRIARCPIVNDVARRKDDTYAVNGVAFSDCADRREEGVAAGTVKQTLQEGAAGRRSNMLEPAAARKAGGQIPKQC